MTFSGVKIPHTVITFSLKLKSFLKETRKRKILDCVTEERKESNVLFINLDQHFL